MPYVAAGVIRAGLGDADRPGAQRVRLSRRRQGHSHRRPHEAGEDVRHLLRLLADHARRHDDRLRGPRPGASTPSSTSSGGRFAIDRLREEALRCRDCEFPTCTANCPAHVDVPAFIRAFADGQIQEAYDVLRRSNVLPEMCACVCPAEVQCEGGCLEQIFSEHALPIRDIQLAVSRLARQAGMTGVRLPQEPTGRRVAVVGAGPAGLACAIRLLEKGHHVTIFEKGERLGGVPDEIIPDSRYHEAGEEIEAILAPAKAAGRIEIRFGHALGKGDITDFGAKRRRSIAEVARNQ